MKKNGISVFYSYSHVDEMYRHELENHLSLLKRNKVIEEWHDRMILPGEEWEEQIDQGLDKADVVILLVSADFLASDYCFGKELKVALQRHEKKEAIVLPIIIRACDWHHSEIGRLQALPKDGKPVSQWKDRDEAWSNVVYGLRRLIARVANIESLQEQVEGIRSENNSSFNIRRELTGIIDELDQRFMSDDRIIGIPTHFESIDGGIFGLIKGHLTIVCGVNENVLTDFSENLLVINSIRNKNVTFYWSENTSSREITNNLLNMISGINGGTLLSGHLDENEWPLLTMAVSALVDYEKNIFIKTGAGLLHDDIAINLSSITSGRDISLLILNGFSIGNNNQENSYSDTAKKLKFLAQEIMVPIVWAIPLSGAVLTSPNDSDATLASARRIFSGFPDNIIMLAEEDIGKSFPANRLNLYIYSKANSASIALAELSYDPTNKRIDENGYVWSEQNQEWRSAGDSDESERDRNNRLRELLPANCPECGRPISEYHNDWQCPHCGQYCLVYSDDDG